MADYWYSVVGMNDYQKSRFVKRVVSAMFNTIRNKKIAMLGRARKRHRPQSRSRGRLTHGRRLVEDGARLAIYDPKVSEEQIAMDMEGLTDNITCYKSAMEALDGAHAVTVMTEWDEFKASDWKKSWPTACRNPLSCWS